MKNLPIGVFDSGVGGLSVVKHLINILPSENIVYLGDTGRVPYGTRSVETIRKYTDDDLGFLLSQNVKAIIAACGTVSSTIEAETIAALPVPFLGVVEPTAQAAVKATKNGIIGIIGTTATVNSRSFEHSIKSINPELEVVGQGCPLLIPLVENGYIDYDNKVSRLVLKDYLETITTSGADTLILGCTHFPLLAPIIADLLGSGITLIDSGLATAQQLKNNLETQNLLSENAAGWQKYYLTDNTEAFSAVAKQFLGFEIKENATKINIEAKNCN